MTSQIRRAVYSVPANIVERALLGSKRDYLHFLYISRGFLAETQYFVHLARRLNYLPAEGAEALAKQTKLTFACLHDRVEIYEPLWLATEAGPERVAQRDSFWSGIVLYREKRWAEAYAEFQKARGSETEDDPALEFYLRRLEPLILQLAQSPAE